MQLVEEPVESTSESAQAPVGPVARRTVVVAGAAGAATLALGGESAYAAPVRKAPGRKRWEQLVGTKFTATLDGRTVTLRLDAVEDAMYRPREASKKLLAKWRRKTYVLVFSSSSATSEGLWTLRHRSTGRFQLYVQPSAAARGRATTRAVINGWKG